MCFVDDDNSYDVQYFHEIRTVTKVGLLPTGNFENTGFSSPVVRNRTIVGFISLWKGSRKFPIDMASIGINIGYYLIKGGPMFNVKWTPGYFETHFIEGLVKSMNEIEPKANNCTKIYVWHTKTILLKNVQTKLSNDSKFSDTNIPELTKSIVFNH